MFEVLLAGIMFQYSFDSSVSVWYLMLLNIKSLLYQKKIKQKLRTEQLGILGYFLKQKKKNKKEKDKNIIKDKLKIK